MKKINELEKKEKIQLLQAIADGTVDRAILTPVTFIAIEKQDWFLGLMMKSENPDLKVINIGEAAIAEKNAFTIEVENEHGEILQKIRTTSK